jgi:hypothetical protein
MTTYYRVHQHTSGDLSRQAREAPNLFLPVQKTNDMRQESWYPFPWGLLTVDHMMQTCSIYVPPLVRTVSYLG